MTGGLALGFGGAEPFSYCSHIISLRTLNRTSHCTTDLLFMLLLNCLIVRMFSFSCRNAEKMEVRGWNSCLMQGVISPRWKKKRTTWMLNLFSRPSSICRRLAKLLASLTTILPEDSVPIAAYQPCPTSSTPSFVASRSGPFLRLPTTRRNH